MQRSLVKLSGLVKAVTIMVTGCLITTTQWFFKAYSHATLRISEGFGAIGPFFFGTYLLERAGRDE